MYPNLSDRDREAIAEGIIGVAIGGERDAQRLRNAGLELGWFAMRISGVAGLLMVMIDAVVVKKVAGRASRNAAG